MNPKKSEKTGKSLIAAAAAAVVVAAAKYVPVVAEKAKEAIPAIIKIVFRRG